MHIKRSANLLDFLKAINICEADVLFCTKEGDVLNLRSELSRYVFAAIAPNAELVYSAEIICKNEQDYALLEAYWEGTGEG